MKTTDPRKRAEEKMVVLLETITDELLAKIKSGDYTPQDVANAIKLLKDNGITVAPNKGKVPEGMLEDLPFHGEHIYVA